MWYVFPTWYTGAGGEAISSVTLSYDKQQTAGSQPETVKVSKSQTNVKSCVAQKYIPLLLEHIQNESAKGTSHFQRGVEAVKIASGKVDTKPSKTGKVAAQIVQSVQYDADKNRMGDFLNLFLGKGSAYKPSYPSWMIDALHHFAQFDWGHKWKAKTIAELIADMPH